MFWQEISPGRYSRPCDANETFLNTLADVTAPFDRAHWTINTIARVETNILDLEKALSQAWLQTRYRTPFLACLIKDKTLVYNVPKQRDIEDWLEESFFVETKSMEQFLLDVRPIRYCSLHYFPASGQVVMRSHHWLVDGVGSLSVLSILLDFLAKDVGGVPTFGDEHTRLPPSHQQINNFPNPSPAAKTHAKKLFAQLISGLPSISLPTKPLEGPLQLGSPKILSVRFDPETTSRIISRCKETSISVSSATHAALIATTQRHASASSRSLPYTSIAAFNYRPYLPAPYNDTRAHPMGAYILGPPVSLPTKDASFGNLARGMHDFYHQPVRKEESLLWEAYETYNGMLLAAFTAPRPEGSPVPTTPEMSCLGVVDRWIEGRYEGEEVRGGRRVVEVLDVEVAVDQIATNVIGYSWSFGGRLGLSLVYNEAVYEDEWMRTFFEDLQKELKAGLGLEN